RGNQRDSVLDTSHEWPGWARLCSLQFHWPCNTAPYLHPNWQEKLAAINRLQIPANFTTPAAEQPPQTELTAREISETNWLRMVGPYGLEPQTSTVSTPRLQVLTTTYKAVGDCQVLDNTQ